MLATAKVVVVVCIFALARSETYTGTLTIRSYDACRPVFRTLEFPSYRQLGHTEVKVHRSDS